MVKIDNKGNKDKRGTAMGYDAIVHIDKRKYTEKTIEDFPACAGVILSSSDANSSTTPFPRVCGGDPHPQP